MAETISCDRGWAGYYDKTAGRPPRETLIHALDRFEAEGRPQEPFAVDLGCGSGRDTVEILRRNWAVLAVDAAPEAVTMLRERLDGPSSTRLRTQVSRFEEVMLPPCDLVNSSFALPLCSASAFPAVWKKIRTCLRRGGRFSGQLYGDRDSWAGRSGMTHHHRAAVDALLASLEVEFLVEEEEDSVTPRGEEKHWHIFHIVARIPR